MSGIAGIVSLDGTALAPDLLPKMVEAMGYWGSAGVQWKQVEGGSIAYLHTPSTPEALYERQPYQLPGGEWLVAAVRLDNRSELLESLTRSYTGKHPLRRRLVGQRLFALGREGRRASLW